MLHLTKVAFGCVSLEDLSARIAARADVVRLTTRYRPKRHAEIVGGSLYWILKHRLVGRSEIVAFEEAEGGRTDIVIKAHVIATVAQPKRAHQGWRYLEARDAPRDLGDGADGADALPAALAGELAAMGLI
ncbi:MAG: DUF1489 family protein [Sphingomonadaceae bacterium]